MLRQQQTTAACTDSAVTKLDNLIDRMKLAGRQTAESWLGSVVSDAQTHERRLSAMTRCLSGIVLAPMITGRKEVPDDLAPEPNNWLRGAILLAATGGIVYLLVTYV